MAWVAWVGSRVQAGKGANEILKNTKSQLHLEFVYCSHSNIHFISLALEFNDMPANLVKKYVWKNEMTGQQAI